MHTHLITSRLMKNPRRLVTDGLRWRRDKLRSEYYPKILPLLGAQQTQWARVVMDRETEKFVRSLNYTAMDAVEISGSKWADFGFSSYRGAGFPEYDLCEGPLEIDRFDFILAEQVFEHLLWPYRAARHALQMLRPGGWLLITTPFLYKVHNAPVDCSRWTELGLKHLLVEAGFEMNDIQTGSWGNRACIKRNWGWRDLDFIPWKHSLDNEPEFPIVVWAFARKVG